jgi:luciferase family oxidoreductase group 1
MEHRVVPLSILDLCPITAGSDARTALMRSSELAVAAERLGYHRYWLAEHHGMPGIASAATAVVIGHVAAATSRIRVGSGGIMLPNHSPLVIAEQFGTLESLFPGRIDLGIGRAPGSDGLTARALRRGLQSNDDDFPRDVIELMEYFSPHPRTPVRAVPGTGLQVPVWILGSSLYGAQLAAALGLPYAFASHFAPAQLMDAIALYRREFRPSARCPKPYLMLAMNVFAAPTHEEAEFLASSAQQAFVNLRSGNPGQLPPPVAGYRSSLGPAEQAMLDQVLSCSAIGDPTEVCSAIEAFIARTGADELMLGSMVFDPAARLRSFAIAAGAVAG